METACNYTDKTMYVSTDERWLINRLLEFKELYPEEVHIIKFPEDNDGCLYLVNVNEYLSQVGTNI